MNLVLDIGNTLVKSGLFEGRELVTHAHFNYDQNLIREQIRAHSGPILVSSVIDLSDFYQNLQKDQLLILNHTTKIPLKNEYLTPETLGNDRLANAVAIHKLSQSDNALAIDCGTCLKFDWVSQGSYKGGSISPGLSIRLKAVHTFTDKLPLIQPKEFVQLNGMNTQESILSGCYRGMLAEIQQTLSDYETKFGKLEVFLTGGDHLFFANHLKNRIFADPFLTLKGLNEILLFQNT